jgi:hypothetical protein
LVPTTSCFQVVFVFFFSFHTLFFSPFIFQCVLAQLLVHLLFDQQAVGSIPEGLTQKNFFLGSFFLEICFVFFLLFFIVFLLVIFYFLICYPTHPKGLTSILLVT